MPVRPPTSVIWNLSLFGRPCVAGKGQTLDQFGTKRAVQLLARLALSHRKAFTRSEAADLLWPDDFFDATRLRLRQELTRLRRGLGPARDLLQTDEEWIKLEDKELQVDVQRFERLFAAIREETDPNQAEAFCREALEVSEGQFLEGHDEAWIEAERSRLEQIRYWILVELAGLQANRSDHEAALETAKRAVEADPLREAGHLKVMEELGKLGRLSDALGQYQHLKRLLRDHLDEAPSAEAETLADSLQRPVISTPQPKPVSSGPMFAVPSPAEPIYGRQEELAALAKALQPGAAGHRLITLVGPGGIGKTRLAQEAAMRLSEPYDGRTGWINLADIADPANIPLAFASELGVTLGSNADPMERITKLLPQEPAMLVIDNLEQLLPEGVGPIRTLAESRSELKLLITSRVPLKLSGEKVFAVGPLPIPTSKESIEQPAMRLFLDALTGEQGFKEPTEEELSVLVKIAEKLEGIPLALQLASGRLRTMTPTELLSQLDTRLEIVNRRVDAPERHKTIRAAIIGSYQALTPELQAAIGRLAVFRGGWNQAAAAQVCGLDDPLSVLEALLDSSLIRVDREDKGIRFRMLETIRGFILESLAEPALQEAREKHADWVIDLGRPEEWRQSDAASLEHFKVVDPERENLREAMRFCLEHDLTRAVKLGATFGRYWWSRSLVREALAFYRALFEHLPGLPPTVELARASYCQANTLYIAQAFSPGDEGCLVSERTASLCEKAGLKLEHALCYLHQARTPLLSGQYDVSLELLKKCEAELADMDVPDVRARLCQHRAETYFYQGKAREALESMEEGTRQLGRQSAPFHEVQNAMMSAFMYLEVEEIGSAKTQAHKALELAETYGFHQFTPMIQEVCGKVALAEGDLDQAANWFGISAKNWDFFGNVYQFADQLHLQARIHLLKNEPMEALPLLAAAANLWQSKNLVKVTPCALTSAARAHLQLGNPHLAARLLAMVKSIGGPTRDSELASEIEFVAAIEKDIAAALTREELETALSDAPDLHQALREAFANVG